MAVAEYVRLDFDDISDNGFHRKPSAIHLRRDMFNSDTLPSIGRCRNSAHSGTFIVIAS